MKMTSPPYMWNTEVWLSDAYSVSNYHRQAGLYRK